MKKWFIGIFLVGLFAGIIGIPSFMGTSCVEAASSKSYIFYVKMVDANTSNPVRNIEVLIKDITTGASFTKTTNSSGIITANIPADFSGSYSDGDLIEIKAINLQNYISGDFWIVGDPVWNGQIIIQTLYGANKYDGGSMGLVDRNAQASFTKGKTIYAFPGRNAVYFQVYYSWSDTGRGLSAQNHRVDVIFNAYLFHKESPNDYLTRTSGEKTYHITGGSVNTAVSGSCPLNFTVVRPDRGVTHHYYFQFIVYWRVDLEPSWHSKTFTTSETWTIQWL